MVLFSVAYEGHLWMKHRAYSHSDLNHDRCIRLPPRNRRAIRGTVSNAGKTGVNWPTIYAQSIAEGTKICKELHTKALEERSAAYFGVKWAVTCLENGGRFMTRSGFRIEVMVLKLHYSS